MYRKVPKSWYYMNVVLTLLVLPDAVEVLKYHEQMQSPTVSSVEVYYGTVVHTANLTCAGFLIVLTPPSLSLSSTAKTRHLRQELLRR